MRRTLAPLSALSTGLAAVLAAGTLSAAAAPTAPPAPATPSAPSGSSGPSCTPDGEVPKRELRADWIASVANIDWPSRPGLPAEQQRAELERWYDEAAARGLNAVVVQVRPTADTFWPSDLEPWSHWLTGTQGQDPGYDPLAFAVEEAHERGLEFHAWFNPYRVSMGTDRSTLAPDHPASLHPEWVHAYGGKLYYDPGVPEVRELTTDVILEVVRRYDVDAVHFDDYFYPYPVLAADGSTMPFPDEATFARYGAGFADLGDWRRDNVDRLIEGLDREIRRVKPWVKLGVSPFAVWRNAATDPEGSATTAGAETYDDLYADTRRWVREEWLDYVAPQIYWNIGFAAADYAVLVPWWSQVVAGTDVQLYVGQATYKVETSTQSPAWQDPREMTRHLDLNETYPEVDGDIYFSAKDVRANRLGHMDIVQAEHYTRPALVPVTEGVPGRAPGAPHRVRAQRTADGVEVSWLGARGAGSYAVYRVEGRGARLDRCDLADAEHLVGYVRQGRTWTDAAAPEGPVTYHVTALDRAYRESRASAPARVR